MIMATSPMSRDENSRGQIQNNAAVSAVLRVALAGRIAIQFRGRRDVISIPVTFHPFRFFSIMNFLYKILAFPVWRSVSREPR